MIASTIGAHPRHAALRHKQLTIITLVRIDGELLTEHRQWLLCEIAWRFFKATAGWWCNLRACNFRCCLEPVLKSCNYHDGELLVLLLLWRLLLPACIVETKCTFLIDSCLIFIDGKRPYRNLFETEVQLDGHLACIDCMGSLSELSRGLRFAQNKNKTSLILGPVTSWTSARRKFGQLPHLQLSWRPPLNRWWRSDAQ